MPGAAPRCRPRLDAAPTQLGAEGYGLCEKPAIAA